ncbi:MAG: redoxin domain-containing protein [Clostridiales bacterium]|nr:redoxin domain-containing protein [Clostridiales bacterium]
MKAFFIKVKNWFVNHMPTKRRLIQLYTFLLYNANSKGYINGTIYQGESKYMCVPGMNCYSCPGAVGACPLGSLQNALNASGNTSAYYVLGILGLFGLICARTICGFLCPVGLGQELLHKIKTPKLRKSAYTRILSYLKYVLLVVLVIAVPIIYGLLDTPMPGFCKYICPAGTFEGGIGLLLNPANHTGDRTMLKMLGPIFTWKFCVLVVIIVASVFMYRPFCRFLCPLGAIYGFFNRVALIGVKLDHNKCTDCGLCIQHCKMDIKHVGDHECINCGECISVCPAKAITWKGSKIFLRGNDIEQPATIEEKPLADIRKLSFNSLATAEVATNNTLTPATAGATNGSSNISTSNVVYSSTEASSAPAHTGGSEMNSSGDANGKQRQKRDRSFWLQMSAWIAALVLLFSMLLYYNVFAPEQSIVDIKIGDPLPTVNVQMYGEDESGRYALLDEMFNVSDHIGEVVVINFWGIWCTPCIGELPYFNQIAEEYPEVKVLAIHGHFLSGGTDDVSKFINRNWRNYKVLFAQGDLNENGSFCLTYGDLGGSSTYPYTVIVDKQGNIAYIQNGSLNYATLKTEVEKVLKA